VTEGGTPETDGEGAPPAAGWPAPFLDALRGDRRVVGAAELAASGGTSGGPAPRGVRVLLLVTTWDGRDAIAADLPRLGALALGRGADLSRHEAERWIGASADGTRVEIEVVRIGDLRPSARGEKATVVLDRDGLLEQWVRWSVGRDRARDRDATPREAVLLEVDEALRRLEAARAADGPSRKRRGAPLVPRLAESLRAGRDELVAGRPEEDALRARIDAALASAPLAGAGVRVVPGSEGPAAALESFLAVADGEGFLGDRTLFAEAVKRLTELSRRAPAFDEGFLLPSFDAVEARWRIGEATGGCSTPLVPGVYVGIGVTPADALEFWAAPFVREPQATVACVADAGTRVVRERTVGKDALIAACVAETEHAWDELPEFLRSARQAARTSAGDLEHALRPLHLPRSYRAAARRALGRLLTPSRLEAALALARAGEGEDPVHARKLGLAAGRLLAARPS
jgi:hypothetical protein